MQSRVVIEVEDGHTSKDLSGNYRPHRGKPAKFKQLPIGQTDVLTGQELPLHDVHTVEGNCVESEELGIGRHPAVRTLRVVCVTTKEAGSGNEAISVQLLLWGPNCIPAQ